MRASVDPDRCAGHGVCVAACDDVFALTEDGFAEVRVTEIPVRARELTRTAALQCPEHAIRIDDE